MRYGLLGVVIALGIGTSLTGAQPNRRDLSPRLTSGTRTAIAALADSLDSAGLPAAVLYDKAAEGALKGADDVRILSVVRALAQRLREARGLLGASAPADDLIAASTALYAGVPALLIKRAADARNVRSSAPSLSLLLTVLTALVSQHVPADVATTSIEALMSRGARELDLQEFQRAVEGDILRGGAPSDAAENSARRAIKSIDARRRPEEGG